MIKIEITATRWGESVLGEHAKETAEIAIPVPAPVSPPKLYPPVFGHWHSDGFGKHLLSIFQSRSGRYFVRRELPRDGDDRFGPTYVEREWWLPASGSEMIPPFAFFFQSGGYAGANNPFLLLSEFDLLAQRPDDWYGLGRFCFIHGHFRLENNSFRWTFA